MIAPRDFYIVSTPKFMSESFPKRWEPSILRDFDLWWDDCLRRRGLERFIRPRMSFSSARFDHSAWVRNKWGILPCTA